MPVNFYEFIEQNIDVSYLATHVSDQLQIDDPEIFIYLARIINILNDFIRRFQLAVALRTILDWDELSKILSQREYRQVTETLSSYLEIICDDSCTCTIDSSDSSASSETVTNVSSEITCEKHSALLQSISILDSYQEVRDFVSLQEKQGSNKSRLLLVYINYISEYIVSKLIQNPDEEKKRELHLRKIWHSNIKLKQTIDNLSKELDRQRKRHDKKMKELYNENERNEEIIDDMEYSRWQNIRTTIIRSEKEQEAVYKKSITTQEELEKYASECEERLKKKKEVFYHDEKELRMIKLKLETQLQSIISKYDADIGERQNVLEELMKEFQTDKDQKTLLEAEMKVQLSIYEEELENLRNYAQEIVHFTQTRAAKIIQRWWRKIFAERAPSKATVKKEARGKKKKKTPRKTKKTKK